MAALPRLATVLPEAGPGVWPAVVASLGAARAEDRERRARRALAPWRIGLASAALVQPVLVLPSLLGAQWLGHGHDARELGAWHLALAVGFLFAAIRPARAWGMMPLVSALVAGLLLTAGIDLAEGRVGLPQELAHAVELAALGCLWALSARVQRPAVRLRAA